MVGGGGGGSGGGGGGSHTQYHITPVPRLGAGALMLNAWDWTVTISRKFLVLVLGRTRQTGHKR